MEYEIIEKKRFVNKVVNWNHKVATDFYEELIWHIDLLKKQPFIGKSNSYNDAKSLLITKHNRLVYKISGNKIIILDLIDTRMKPKK